MEVDPGFSSACTEYLLVHILGDLLTAAANLTHLKVVLTCSVHVYQVFQCFKFVEQVLASQTGLKVSDFALMLELNKRTEHVAHLKEARVLKSAAK